MMLKVNESYDKHALHKLIESVHTNTGLAIMKLPMLEDEVSMTITQFLSQSNSISTTNDPVETNLSGTSSEFIMNAPLDNLNELASKINRCENRSLTLYINTNDTVLEPSVVTDTEGDEFVNTIKKPVKVPLLVGTVSRDESNRWSVRLAKSFKSSDIDFEMYVRCWSGCTNNKLLRDFLNDIYTRVVNKVDTIKVVDHPEAIMTNESIQDDQVEDDGTTYAIEYEPDKVLVYISENFDVDLNEDMDETEQDELIQDFFESIFNVDDSKIIHINEKLSKILLPLAAGLAMTKATDKIISKLGLTMLQPNENQGYDISKFR